MATASFTEATPELGALRSGGVASERDESSDDVLRPTRAAPPVHHHQLLSFSSFRARFGLFSEYGGGPRLRFQCEVCRKNPSKYKCPRCLQRTCSLDCVKRHKLETGCSGKRDRTGFERLNQFNDNKLLSDYLFLEEVQRTQYAAQRSRPRARHSGPALRLKLGAQKHGVSLVLLSEGMERRRNNTSVFTAEGTLEWRIAWLFHGVGDPIRVVDERVADSCTIRATLQRHWDDPEVRTRLAAFVRTGLDRLLVCMRIEGRPADQPLYRPLALDRDWRAQLAGQCVIEHPVVHVVLPALASRFSLQPAHGQHGATSDSAASDSAESTGSDRTGSSSSSSSNTESSTGSDSDRDTLSASSSSQSDTASSTDGDVAVGSVAAAAATVRSKRSAGAERPPGGKRVHRAGSGAPSPQRQQHQTTHVSDDEVDDEHGGDESAEEDTDEEHDAQTAAMWAQVHRALVADSLVEDSDAARDSEKR